MRRAPFITCSRLYGTLKVALMIYGIQDRLEIGDLRREAEKTRKNKQIS